MNICTFNQQQLSADGTQNTATSQSRQLGYCNMTVLNFKQALTIFTVVICLTLPFLVSVLTFVYGIDSANSSLESFQIYKNQLVPTRDFILSTIVLLCITSIAWTLASVKQRRLRAFDIIALTIMTIATLFILIAKTVLPNGSLIQ